MMPPARTGQFKMLRNEFRTVLFCQFAQFVVSSEKPDNPEDEQHYPDNLDNDQGDDRIENIFKSVHG